MQADIFIGVVFYQRLRHMVSDKSQVRATGPITALTRQPVKGRKRHGGIRLGEMERDALLSHGVAFCLQDRLMNCSDSHVGYLCGACGSMLTVYSYQTTSDSSSSFTVSRRVDGFKPQYQQYCATCKTSDHVRAVQLPYVLRYLTNELAAMGIKMKFELKE